MLATLRSNNRSGALKGKQRIAQKQRSATEGLEGWAYFLEYKIYSFYWSHVNNKLFLQITSVPLADVTNIFPVFCMPERIV